VRVLAITNADIAARTPPLAEGLTALDVVRQTLDSILGGAKAYGCPPGTFRSSRQTRRVAAHAADDCVRGGNSDRWLAANYTGIRLGRQDACHRHDERQRGWLNISSVGTPASGPTGSDVRPANWWDTIGFGHEDAYGNALTYRALGSMEHMARKLGKTEDAARYHAAAEKLHDVYFKTFYNPATGVSAVGAARRRVARLLFSFM